MSSPEFENQSLQAYIKSCSLSVETITQLSDIKNRGVILIDRLHRVRFWNDWIAERSGISASYAISQRLDELFGDLSGSRLEQATEVALSKGMSSVLSQVFHQHPLPLYPVGQLEQKKQRIFQKIYVKPLLDHDVYFALVEVSDVSEKVKTERDLRQAKKNSKEQVEASFLQEKHLRNILDCSADAIITLSNKGVVLESNKAALSIFRVEEKSFHGEKISKFVPKFDMQKINTYSLQTILQGITTDNCEISLEVMINQLVESETFSVLTLRDVTQKLKIKEAAFRSEKLAKTALESIADGVITTNEGGVIELFNPIAAELLQKQSAQLEGFLIDDVFRLVDEKSLVPQENIVLQAIKQEATIDSDAQSAIFLKSKRCLPIMATASPIFDSRNRVSGCVLVFRDVLESRRLSSKLSWEASHDALTGLVNRRAFNQKLEYEVKNSTGAILLFLDLDRFKLVNDTAGHSIGDELLKQISQIFIKFFREGDFISRLGGDEFAVILERCPLEKARQLAQELCTKVEQFPFPWEDRIFTVGVSIGLSQIDDNDQSPSKVIERADAACYSAKQSGRSRVHVYGESQQETEYQEKINRASDISEAIAHDRFVLYKQPIVSIADGVRKLHHYEILIRMLDENNNIIPPNDFIPAAEQFGLMQAVDRYVITKVCKFINENRNKKRTPFAINLSGASIIDERFMGFLSKLVEKEAIIPKDMHFEITETAAIANLSRARSFLEHFKSRGFSFALDDFGSGMSSFGYLKNLPIDYIKIDGQFVREIVGNETDFAMVSSINYLGHMMGLKCIAEFVENDETLDVLDKIGVDFAQGFGIERPTPLFDESNRP